MFVYICNVVKLHLRENRFDRLRDDLSFIRHENHNHHH